ncbi:hypothetical protein PQX77_000952, partial [Marasmius sp. AFHP31]
LEEYVELEVIDLSEFRQYDSEASGIPLSPDEARAQEKLIERARDALRSVGFVAMRGHGLNAQDIQHQFDLARLLNVDVPEEEKRRLHARIAEEGSWAGYKPCGYYNRPDGSYDNIEVCILHFISWKSNNLTDMNKPKHYDLYPFTALKSRLPEVARPYLDDIRQFMEHNHYSILRRLLAVISLGVGLDREALWNLHHRDGLCNDGALQGGPDEEIKWQHSKDHLRLNADPRSDEDRRQLNGKGLVIPGHTDLGSVTFLYSQPVAGLQLLTSRGEWRFVKHYPDHIIVDLGDSMEFLTGGVLKASPHRD